MAEEETPFTVDEIDEAVRETYSELLDVNQKMIRKSRRQAEKLEEIIELYAEQMGRLGDLRDMHIQGAMALSETIAEILAAEWDIQDDDDPEDDLEEETAE